VVASGDRKFTGSNFGCTLCSEFFPHSFSQSSSGGTVTSACIWKHRSQAAAKRTEAARLRSQTWADFLGHFQLISLLPRPKKHSQSISG
jgi:hypothetical protein